MSYINSEARVLTYFLERQRLSCDFGVSNKTLDKTYLRNSITNSRHLQNVTIQLHYRHPTSRRNVDGTDDYNVASLDTTWPDPP